MSVKAPRPSDSGHRQKNPAAKSSASRPTSERPVTGEHTLNDAAAPEAQASEPTRSGNTASRASLIGNSVARLVKRNNMELQFWSYEIGNVLATIAGAGGFYVFYRVIQSVFGNPTATVCSSLGQLLTLYPDATVTLGLGTLVLVVPALRARFFSTRHPQWLNAVDLTTTVVAAAILCYSLLLDTSWIAVASSCFVLGSCLLRQCRSNPLLLKAGGLALAGGGLGLALFGLQIVMSQPSIEENPIFWMGALSFITGIYVMFASLLTYEGGIHASRDFISEKGDSEDRIWLSRIAHPESGLLQGLLVHADGPIMNFNRGVSKPAVFWASVDTRQRLPFKTSMLARLPWRVLTGLAALWSLTPEGFAFFTANVCWALGDIAIGSEDW